MNIYIFASRNINDQSKSRIKRLRIRVCDKIVLLNTPNDESINFLLNEKYENRLIDFRFIRGHPHQLTDEYKIRCKNKFNHSLTEYYISEPEPLNKIILANRLRGKIVNVLNRYERDKGIYIPNHRRYKRLGVKYDWTRGKRPSIGFIAVKLLRKRFPNSKIYLCGFTFKMSESFHDAEFEKNHLLNELKDIYVI